MGCLQPLTKENLKNGCDLHEHAASWWKRWKFFGVVEGTAGELPLPLCVHEVTKYGDDTQWVPESCEPSFVSTADEGQMNAWHEEVFSVHSSETDDSFFMIPGALTKCTGTGHIDKSSLAAGGSHCLWGALKMIVQRCG